MQFHELRMRVRPFHRFALRFKVSVDHDGLELAGSACACARGFATDNCRAGVNGSAGAIGEDDFAAIRNPLWIDGAMPGSESSAGTSDFGAFTCPIAGDASKDRLLAREGSGCER